MIKNKKTVVVVSATIMLLMIAAVAIVYYKNWTTTLTNEKIIELKGQLDEIEILELGNQTLLIKNYNNLNLTILDFYIDKNKCSSMINKKIKKGYSKLNISACQNYTSSNTYIIGIITNEITLNKKLIYSNSLKN